MTEKLYQVSVERTKQILVPRAFVQSHAKDSGTNVTQCVKKGQQKKRKYIKSLLFNIISDVKFPGQVAYCLRLTKMQGAFKIPFRNLVNRQDDEHARQGKYCFIPQGYLLWLRNLHFLASWPVLKCLHITSMIPVHSTTILSMFPLFALALDYYSFYFFLSSFIVEFY